MSSFADRMLRAAKLDPEIYEEVEADESATPQAALVVVLSGLAAGVGSLGYTGDVSGLIVGTLGALLGWVIWAALIWAIGTKLLPEAETEADIGQLLRTIGFAATPGILRAGGFIAGIGPVFVLVGSIWMLVATIIGVRQALDYRSTWRAVGVCAIGWVVLLVVQLVIMQIAGPSPMPMNQ